MPARRFALLILFSLGACPRHEPPPMFVPPTDSLLLDIPDRPWATGAPKEGWCGEASVQMAALHFGAYVPQARINELGRPKTPDLWEQDVPTALAAMGLGFTRYGDRAEVPLFLGWIVGELRQRHPVLVGLKIYPTVHPEWDVDHMVLVVGFSPNALVINTNQGEQQISYAYKKLGEKSEYSFVVPNNRLHGFAITGFGGIPVSAQVTEEGESTRALEVQISGLEPGQRYRLLRDDLSGNQKPTEFVAVSREQVRREVTPVDKAAVFSCTRLQGAADAH